MKNQNKEGRRIWIMIILIIVVLVLILPKLFKYFKKSRRTRLEEEIEQLEAEIRILQPLKNGEQKQLERFEFLNKYVPYLIRVFFVISLFVYDYVMLVYFHKINSELTIILKEVTIYNASFLSVLLCITFIFNGKMWKIEEMITYINQSINNQVFNYYFSKTDRRQNSKTWYREDIEKRESQIVDLKVELTKNGVTSYSK